MVARGRLRAGSFSFAAWDEARRHEAALAVRRVPFYRERRAARQPVPARELEDQHFRLCPLTRPFDPRREPSLWTGDAGALADALRLAGALDPVTPVLEIRRALVDRSRLGRGGPAYRPLLAAGADAEPGHRAALEADAAAVAAGAGRAFVVGSPEELAAALPGLRAAAGGGIDLAPVRRLSPAAAARDGESGSPAVLQDPFLDYLGALVPPCGRFHVLWRRVHVRFDDEGPVVTRLRASRPTLVDVRPVEPGFAAVEACALHGTPALVP